MEKREPVQNVVLGKLDSHMSMNEIRTLPNTIHKNKLQMDERPRYKTRHSKTPRGKQAKHSLTEMTATSPQIHLLK